MSNYVLKPFLVDMFCSLFANFPVRAVVVCPSRQLHLPRTDSSHPHLAFLSDIFLHAAFKEAKKKKQNKAETERKVFKKASLDFNNFVKHEHDSVNA